jgi:photosystem II stability/assembly factor-like uncharacterized protein
VNFNTGVTTVVWRVYDAVDNTGNCTFTVTVADNEAPSIVCPPDQPSAACGQTDTSYTGQATATDNCDPDPVIAYSDVIAGNVITRTWTATDASANSVNCQQIITTNDYSAPTMQTIVEPEGEYYDTAPTFSVFGFEDDCDLNDGFYQLDGYSGSWMAVNNGLPTPFIHALALKTANTIFAGTLNYGVFRSTDNGDTWMAVNNGMPNISVYALAVCPTGSNIFAGTLDSSVYRSTDNGDTWMAVNNGMPSVCVYTLAINHLGDIFAGTIDSGIYRSTDNGDSWVQVNSGLASKDIYSLAINSAGDIFAGTYGGGVFRSMNNGDTWTSVSGIGMPSIITVRAIGISDNGDIFAGTWGGGVYRSTDNGDTWTNINSGLMNFKIRSMALSTTGYVFAGTAGSGVFRSADNGESWVSINNGLGNNSISSLVVNLQDDVFAGTSGGGVFRAPNNGESWITLFSDVSGTTWNDNGWTLPGFDILAPGSHTIYFMVNDDVNNVSGAGGEISWQFYKDSDPPIITLIAPENGETTTDHFMQLSATVNDDSPPVSVWIYGGNDSDPQTMLLAEASVDDGATLIFDWNIQRLTTETGYTMGLWHFDNYGSSTVYDSSGHSNDGSFEGDACYTWDGRFGYAIEFDGSDCALSIPDNASLDIDSLEGALTVEAWIYPYAVADDAYHTIVCKRGSTLNYQVSLDRYTGNLLFYSGHWPEVFISDVYIPANTWSYIAVTVDVTSGSGDAIFYLNGVPADTITDTVVFGAPNDGPLMIGVNNTALTEEFNGVMDEIRLTSRALSASEIAANYELGLGDYYWRVVAEDGEHNSDTSEIRIFTVGLFDCFPGQANGIEPINILDITYLISYLYQGGPEPVPYRRCSGDPNCDCSVNILDITYLINYLYLGGPVPCSGQNWYDICHAEAK